MELLEINSTEKILENQVKNFLHTNLKLKGIKFSRKTRYIYSYVESLCLYQIILFEDEIPEFLFFKTSKKNEIYLYKDYAVVYKNMQFYYCQKLENAISINEVINFLQKSLNLNNVYVIEDIRIDKNKNLTIHKPIKSNILKYFLGYFIILISIFYFYEFNTYNKNSDLKDIITNTKNIKDEIKFTSISKLVEELFDLANKNKVNIMSVILKNAKLDLKLESKRKDAIYSFFNSIKKESLEDITFDTESKRFIGNVTIKIDRR
ncbi:hypothetical protein [Halarcobacter sp.]|uniref:hypothetical protein n=1 Tax=Halarcobacter sp. TaxID=2321133 RepID=UPI002AA8DC2B|nr:hypothetical protein [Halarcobacter sp.]